ncbi:la-related protein 6-like [Actinia tenebrosa]|uniref:La-related protein 6-like n=1 Tax=Actinia tenebrosa TaxID=6105 RepID=A0A6P8IWJ2_ACTTE|nr:la-related protein 6-like [Actinia tenebrosa]
MADGQSDNSAVKKTESNLENSPKVLVNGEEFVGCSDQDLAASSNSEEENDKKLAIRSPSAADSHSDTDLKDLPDVYSPPNDELKQKIIAQVELYLSDENLSRDAFLLKHVRRNKEGYVNLKLITSFKKVKSLTKDYRVVGESLKESTKLTLNAEVTKVKRNSPLPTELLERNPGRTVIATKMDEPTFEHVSEMFSKCGEIILIRIIRPGKSIPSDVKSYLSKTQDLTTETFAIVEFETMAAAARACSELTKEGGMKVVELGKQTKKKEKAKNRDRDGEPVPDSDEEHDDKTKRKRNRGKRNKNKRLAELAGTSTDEGHTSSCSSDTDSSYNPFSSCQRRYRNSPSNSPKGSPKTSRREIAPTTGSWRSPQSSPEPARKSLGTHTVKEGSSSAPNSPWSQRRKTALPSGHSPLADSELVKHRMVQLEGVQRLPKGPDGTKGFRAGVGRGRPMIAVA